MMRLRRRSVEALPSPAGRLEALARRRAMGDDGLRGSQVQGALEAAAVIPRLRILFVDDEPLLADAAVRAIEAFGHSVEGYTSPLRAWERFDEDPSAFDAVVVDRHMPGLDGPALAQRVRERRPGTCIILCSGFHTEAPDTGHPGALYDAVFDKPSRMETMLAAISTIVASRSRS